MADAPEEKKDDKKPPEKRSMLVWIIIGVIILIEIPVMFFIIKVTRPKDPVELAAQATADSLAAVSKMATEVGVTYETPVEAIVNIAQTGGDRYLKVRLLLEFDDDKYPDSPLLLTSRLPHIKNILIEVLSTMTLQDLADVSAKSRIKNVFMTRVNAMLPAKKVQLSNVLFDEYLIQ